VDNHLGYQDEITKREKELVLKAFEDCWGSHNEAASRLGVHPNYLYRLIQNLKLQNTVDLLKIRHQQAESNE
jgi:DNA-binding NtrC family response regulator